MKLEAKTRLSKLTAKVGRALSTTSGGTYVCALPSKNSKAVLAKVAKALGVVLTPEQQEELHCTLMYSRGTLPSSLSLRHRKYGARVSGIEFWDGHDNDGYVVVTLTSPDLENRHRELVASGLVHSFEDYTPHVTLFSKVKSSPELVAKISKIRPLVSTINLSFESEQVEGIKPESHK